MPAWTRARQPSGAAGHHPPPRRRAAWVFFGSSQGVCGGVPLTDQTPMPPSPDQVPGMQDRPPAGAAQRPQVRPVEQARRGHGRGGPVDDHRRRTIPARLTDRVRLPVGSAACLPDPGVQQTGGHENFCALWGHAAQGAFTGSGGMGVNLRGVPAPSIRRQTHFMSVDHGSVAGPRQRPAAAAPSYPLIF